MTVNQPEQHRPRLPPSTPAEAAPLVVVIVGVVAGLVAVFLDQWRLGCLLIGAFLTIGGIERLLLPKGRAGLLEARSRFFDVIALFGMGIAIMVLAIWVPSSS